MPWRPGTNRALSHIFRQMIYVDNPSTNVRILIPRTLAATLSSPALEIVGTADRQRHDVPVLDHDNGVLYYALRVNLSGIPDGEYEYTLSAGTTALATGIMRLGAVPADPPVEYAKTAVYEQYNP